MINPSLNKNETVKSAIWLGLILAVTFYLYYPVFHFDFVNWDDDRYVYDNPHIKEFTWEKIKYVFTHNYFSMYLPVTLLSYMVDYQIGEFDPHIFHTTNVIFHLLNTLLLFFFIKKLFSIKQNKYSLGYAVAVSLLFGIHTLHIESVTWIAERKDVVYSFFYLISLLTYLQYLTRKKAIYLIGSIFLFLLSLISKAQAMPLIFILILIDYFLGRKWHSLKVLAEKMPYFMLAAVFGVIAIFATREEGASTNAGLPLIEKLVYASYGFITYIIKLFAPFNLSAIYPYPDKPDGHIQIKYWLYIIPVLLYISATVFCYLKKKRTLFMALMLYALSIVIVLQLFAYHNFVMADRYTYISSIGIFLLIPAFYEYSMKKFPQLKFLLLGLFFIFCLFISIKTIQRQKDWENSKAIWEDIQQKYPQVIIAYYNYGNYLLSKNDLQGAVAQFDKTIKLKPDHIGALSNRGITYGRLNMPHKALPDFNKVISLDANYKNVYSNRGNTYIMLGKDDKAIEDYTKAITLNPDFTDALFNRAMAYYRLQKWELSIQDFNKVLKKNPHHQVALYSRGISYTNLEKFTEALTDYNMALSLNNKNTEVYFARGIVYKRLGKTDLAINDWSKVIALNNKIALPYFYRGIAYIETRNKEFACKDLEQALKLGYLQAENYLQKYCK